MNTHLTQIMVVADKDEGDYFVVFVDGGDGGRTTHMKGYLHGYKCITSRKVFHDSGKRTRISVGEGYMKLLCGSNYVSDDTHICIHCYHTPNMHVAVLSPGRFVIRHSNKYRNVQSMRTTGRR
jgi:hypothetical protein